METPTTMGINVNEDFKEVFVPTSTRLKMAVNRGMVAETENKKKLFDLAELAKFNLNNF